jgi:hypothetical protein
LPGKGGGGGGYFAEGARFGDVGEELHGEALAVLNSRGWNGVGGGEGGEEEDRAEGVVNVAQGVEEGGVTKEWDLESVGEIPFLHEVVERVLRGVLFKMLKAGGITLLAGLEDFSAGCKRA